MTLLIFIYQTNLIRKQNYISILPYLSISTSDSSANSSYKISLENYGVGPAIIEGVTINYLGEEYDLKNYDNEMLRFLASRHSEFDSIQNFSYSTLDPGLAIPANTTYHLIEIKNDSSDYKLFKNSIEQVFDKGFHIEIRYKSIQNEHWVINNVTRSPEKLD